MGLIDKLTKRGAANIDVDDEDDDDLDLDVEAGPEDGESVAGGLKAGLMGRLRSLRNRGGSKDDDGNDDDDDGDPKDLLEQEDEVAETGSGQRASGDAPEPDEDENLPEVQVVRLEGVPDVRVVGDSNGAAAPSGPQPGNAPAISGQGGAGGGNSAAGGESSPTQAAVNAGPPTANEGNPKSEAKEGGEGSGLSLMDIFEEEVEVDETMRDLAESMEDGPAQELADDLRAFFEELEASMK